MYYIGGEESYTPLHIDSCASLGHNLMCAAERGGYADWYMTATRDAPLVREFCRTDPELQHEVDWEQILLNEAQMQRAPCTIYMTRQQVGDWIDRRLPDF